MAFLPICRKVGLLIAALFLGIGASAQEPPADTRAEIIHVLNRITFGPRPRGIGDLKNGHCCHIEQQLHPENIDDLAVDQKVGQFELLQMGWVSMGTHSSARRHVSFRAQRQDHRPDASVVLRRIAFPETAREITAEDFKPYEAVNARRADHLRQVPAIQPKFFGHPR